MMTKEETLEFLQAEFPVLMWQTLPMDGYGDNAFFIAAIGRTKCIQFVIRQPQFLTKDTLKSHYGVRAMEKVA